MFFIHHDLYTFGRNRIRNDEAQNLNLVLPINHPSTHPHISTHAYPPPTHTTLLLHPHLQRAREDVAYRAHFAKACITQTIKCRIHQHTQSQFNCYFNIIGFNHLIQMNEQFPMESWCFENLPVLACCQSKFLSRLRNHGWCCLRITFKNETHFVETCP